MLGLKLETDPRWVNIVEEDLEEILQNKKAMNNIVSKAQDIKSSSQLSEKQIAEFREKINTGFYDNPDVVVDTADKIIDLLT